MLENNGDMPDGSNIPVNCYVEKLENGQHKWSGSNYMPRKELVVEDGYEIIGEKKEIIEWIKKHVIPLYENAIKCLEETCELNYWDKPEGEKNDDDF